MEPQSLDFPGVGDIRLQANYGCAYEVGLGPELFRATWSGANAGLSEGLEELGRKAHFFGSNRLGRMSVSSATIAL
jgi:hypothetical protein